ncbi:MAG: amidohydrolase family protein, partial [Actinomycetota bacterium]
MQSPSSTNDGSLLIHSGILIDGEGSRPGWLLVENGQVVGVGAPDEPLPPAVHLIDASNGYVVPGFVDIHCNGAGGAHCQDGADEALRTLQTMRSHGTTRLLASLVTASIDSLVSSIEQLHVAMDQDPALIGIHLEGPFLTPERVGAHDLRYLRHPDPQSIDRLLAAANGRLRKVTLAPELPGAL